MNESRRDTGPSLREFYELDGQRRDHWMSRPTETYVRLDRLRYDRIIEGLSGPYRRAADIGCGSGVVASRLVSLSELTIALDLANVRLGQVRAGVPRASLLQADVCALPFRDGSLDLLVASETVEHLPDYRPALREMARVLDSGGTCVLSVPYREELEEQVCPHCLRRFPMHGHLHSFDEQTLGAAIRAVGLEPREFVSLNNTVATKLARLFAAPYPILKLLDRISRRLLPHLNHHLIVFAHKPSGKPQRHGGLS